MTEPDRRALLDPATRQRLRQLADAMPPLTEQQRTDLARLLTQPPRRAELGAVEFLAAS